MTIRVAFVVPVYNEEQVIEEFHKELSVELLQHPNFSPELIFVDDGSKDNSRELIKKLQSSDPRITLITLAANRGQQLALTAGIDYTHEFAHDIVVIMDADLQDPPAVALAMAERVASGVDMVYGQRRSSNGRNFGKRFSSDTFYRVLAKLSDVEMPARTSDFRAANSKVISEVVKYREHSRFLRGIFSHVGFTQEPYSFDRPERFAGESKYTYLKLFKLAFDAIMGYSTFPLRVISSLGVLASFFTIIFGLWIVISKIVDPEFAVYGWASTTLIISFFAGLQLLTLGVMGSYIGRIYIQSMNRPLYALRSIERGKLEGDQAN